MPNYVYVPDEDDNEMSIIANQLKVLHGFEVLSGKKKMLQRVSPLDRLYLLCHGHKHMPLFSLTDIRPGHKGKKPYEIAQILKSDPKSWTAEEMALLLVSDGLPKTTKEMELLVCHAGQSVADIKDAKALLKIRMRKRAMQAKGKYDKGSDEYLGRQFDSIVKMKTPARHYVSDKQAFPLAAQLFRELYSRGFTRLRITSYKAPVDQYISPKKPFRPLLDLRSEGGKTQASLDDNPQYIAVYTAALFRRLGWSLDPKDMKQPLSCW